MAVTPSIKELKDILKPMSWKDRLEYLWTYYKSVLVALLGLVMLISVVVNSIQNRQIKVLYSGLLMSVQMESEEQDSIVQDLTSLFQGDGNKQIVELAEVTYIAGDDAANMGINNATAMKINTMVAAEALDFILTDRAAYEDLLQYSIYQDLRAVLSEEQQTMLQDHIIWKEASEDMPSFPMALDVSDTEFIKHHALYGGEVYLVFIGNTDNGSRDQAFVDYILNWTE